MGPRHISLFIHSLNVGGIQKIVVRLANEFAARGHKVDLVLARGSGPVAVDVGDRVRVIDLAATSIWKAIVPLRRFLREAKPDVLFAAEEPINVAAVAATRFLRDGLRLVLSVRSNISQYAESDNVWYAGLIPLAVRVTFPVADAVICVSRGVLGDLERIAPRAARDAVVVYNPVVGDHLLEAAKQPSGHAWLDDSRQPVVLGVGRLTEQKNFPLLLSAFAAVRQTHEARLVILGDGHQREELMARMRSLAVEDCVDLPGTVMNPYSFMSRARVFVLSSDYEGFGSVLVEAMACGCPVVSTDCPSGPGEILNDGEYGTLVPVGDEHAMADAIRHALDSEHDRDRLVRRAMDFGVDRAVDAYLDVLLPAPEVRS